MARKNNPPAAPPAADVTEKRRVSMKSVVALTDGGTAEIEANDYVPLDILDAYVADARTRWQVVEVKPGHDPGPGGDKGETKRPKLR